MAELLRNRITLVWIALMLATLMSWWLGSEHGVNSASAATIAVIAVALVKVRYVGMYFMELRHAPPVLRLLLDGYAVVVCAALIGMYVLL